RSSAEMLRYLAQRLLALIPVVILVTSGVFLLMRMTPGDPVVTMLGDQADPAAVRALRRQLGLDQPLPVQYATWLANVARGHLGQRTRPTQGVGEAVADRRPTTAELGLLAMLVSLSIAVPAGITAATRWNTPVDGAATIFAVSGVSIPNFWLAIMLIYVFSVKLGWLPPIGYVNPRDDLAANLKGMVMPALALGTALAAVVTRPTRSGLVEVLRRHYVRAARAKGLSEWRVVTRHALKTALIPVITVVGLQVGNLLGGAVIVETIFVLPGVGRLLVDAIFSRDFPVVQGVVFFLAIVFILVNLIVD